MKKTFVLAAILAGIFVFGSTTSASAAPTASSLNNYSAGSAAQIRTRLQVVTVQRGRRVFRETYRISRYRNGRVIRQLISRTRVR